MYPSPSCTVTLVTVSAVHDSVISVVMLFSANHGTFPAWPVSSMRTGGDTCSIVFFCPTSMQDTSVPRVGRRSPQDVPRSSGRPITPPNPVPLIDVLFVKVVTTLPPAGPIVVTIS